METPKGLQLLEELAWYLSNNAPLAFAQNLFQAAELMKEMAEALEDVGSAAKEECTFEDTAADCGVYEALKKFKEWK